MVPSDLRQESNGSSFPPRLWVLLSLLAWSLCASTVSCSPADETASVGEVRALNERMDRVDLAFRELPERSPEQIAARNTIRLRLSAAKIEFRAKFNARLGTVSRELQQRTIRELDRVEALMEHYPK